MISIVFVAALLACANAGILPSGRIVGGSTADITEAPYTAALLIDSTGLGTYSQACGAVIVGSRLLLTSAQCASPFTASRLRVRAGSTYHNTGGEILQVASYVIHPSYSASTFANDLAILTLNTTITLGSTAATITLPAQNLTIADGTSCLFYGWGTLTSGGSTPVNLYKVTLPVINQAICVSAYSGINTVTTDMLCLGRHGVGGVGTCAGDIGGPLVNGGILHGIASWGRGCAEPNFPSIFTRISSYRTWLNGYL